LRLLRPTVAFALCFAIVLTPVVAQQTTTVIHPGVLLQKSLAALTPSGIPTDITLTGSAHRIAGSDDETGTVTLKVLSPGATRLELNFPLAPASLETKSSRPNNAVHFEPGFGVRNLSDLPQFGGYLAHWHTGQISSLKFPSIFFLRYFDKKDLTRKYRAYIQLALSRRPSCPAFASRVYFP